MPTVPDGGSGYLFVPVYVHNSYYEESDLFINVFDSVIKEKVDENYQDDFFDFIIDDGSHEIRDQIQTFCNFYPKLKENGVYVIEDIEIHYIEEFKKIFKDVPSFTLKKDGSDQGIAYLHKTKEFDYEDFYKKNYDPELLFSDPSGCTGGGDPEASLEIHAAYCTVEANPEAAINEFYIDIEPGVSFFEERPFRFGIFTGHHMEDFKAADPYIEQRIADEIHRIHSFYCDMRSTQAFFKHLSGAI